MSAQQALDDALLEARALRARALAEAHAAIEAAALVSPEAEAQARLDCRPALFASADALRAALAATLAPSGPVPQRRGPPCRRCGGTGYLPWYSYHDGGRCYACQG